MRALSVRQPWAWAIARGFKDLENRSWSTDYRGQLAIHAPATVDDDDLDGVIELAAAGFPSPALAEWDLRIRYAADRLAKPGGVVAVARVAAVVGASPSRWFVGEGLYGWVLEGVRALPEPVPCKGRLGLWELPADVRFRVFELLGGA